MSGGLDRHHALGAQLLHQMAGAEAGEEQIGLPRQVHPPDDEAVDHVRQLGVRQLTGRIVEGEERRLDHGGTVVQSCERIKNAEGLAFIGFARH